MRLRTDRPRALRRALALALAGVMAVGITACAPSAAVPIDVPTQVEGALPDETVTQLQDAVTYAMAATGSTGAVVGVWAPWSGTWVTGVGTTEPGGSETSPDMTFRAAQVTRAMTCDVMYVLAEDGVLELDAPVTEYVSGVAGLSDITLEQLCDGTSGLGDYAPRLLGMFLQTPDRVWNPRELVAYGVGTTADVTPGTVFRDSDAGYLLAGLAIERATGRTAAELLEEYVFAPLALEGTRLPRGAAAPPATERPVLDGLWSPDAEGGGVNCAEPRNLTESSASFGWTDSGVVSTIDDLGRYAQGLAANALGVDADERYDAPLPPYDGAPSWHTTAGGVVQAGSLLGQYGSTPGYITAAFADPETGLTVAVVLNNSRGGGGFGAFLAWQLAAIASKAPAASGQTAPAAGLPWTPEQQRDAITQNAICPLP
jgi:D-alanyl-D-alanine carboxypeptidase